MKLYVHKGIEGHEGFSLEDSKRFQMYTGN